MSVANAKTVLMNLPPGMGKQRKLILRDNFRGGGLLAGEKRTSQKDDNNKSDITDYSRGLLLKYIEIFFMF